MGLQKELWIADIEENPPDKNFVFASLNKIGFKIITNQLTGKL